MDATQGSVSPADAEELKRLRRRAYGPDADIGADAVAQARLAELESTLGHLPTSFPAATGPDDPNAPDHPDAPTGAQAHTQPVQPAASPVASIERPGDEGHDVVAAGTPTASTVTRWRRAVVWIAAGIGVVTLVGLLAAVFVLPGAPPDETLRVSADMSQITQKDLAELDVDGMIAYLGLHEDDIVQYDDFRAVNVWSAPTVHGTTCLILTRQTVGLWAVSCAPPGTEPHIDMNKYANEILDPDVPDPWNDMPSGSLIRFILRGDTVLVWDIPAPGPTSLFD